MKKVTKKTTTKKAPKLGAEKPKKLDFFLEVNTDGFVYKGSAITMADALKGFVDNPNFPNGAKTKVIIRFGKGTSLHTRIYSAVQARRLFNQIKLKPVAVELLANNFLTQIG